MTRQRMPPAQRFRRFENVDIIAMPPRGEPFVGRHGTVLWADPPQRPSRPDDWAYCVFVPGMACHITALESDLRSTGTFDAPNAHLGTRFEISHDLLPDDRGEFSFVEGTYRRPGTFWEVMIFTKDDVPTVEHQFTTWPSGITGIAFRVPRSHRLDKAYVARAMSDVFRSDVWTEVKGPDSMILR